MWSALFRVHQQKKPADLPGPIYLTSIKLEEKVEGDEPYFNIPKFKMF